MVCHFLGLPLPSSVGRQILRWVSPRMCADIACVVSPFLQFPVVLQFLHSLVSYLLSLVLEQLGGWPLFEPVESSC